MPIVKALVDFAEGWFDPKQATASRRDPGEKPKAALKDKADNIEEGEHTAESKDSKDWTLDRDGDGDVDMDDLMAMAEADVDGEAADDLSKINEKPYFIVTQIILCVLLWLAGAAYESFSGTSSFFLSQGGIESFAPGWTATLVHRDCEDLRLQAWRWITYQWTHGHFTHIAMNTLVTVFAGIPLEGLHGWKRTAFIFEASVMCGALWHMTFRPHDNGLVGMSAGCYALMAMHMADVVMNWRQHRYRFPRVFLLLVMIALDVGASSLAKPDDVTGHAAHFGGYLSGLIFGVFFVRNKVVTKCEKVLKVVMALIGLGCLGFCFYRISMWAPASLWDDGTPWCWARQAYSYTYFGDQEWHCLRCPDDACAAGFVQVLAASISPVSYIACDTDKLWWN